LKKIENDNLRMLPKERQQPFGFLANPRLGGIAEDQQAGRVASGFGDRRFRRFLHGKISTAVERGYTSIGS
jgi:hypothetical protein